MRRSRDITIGSTAAVTLIDPLLKTLDVTTMPLDRPGDRAKLTLALGKTIHGEPYVTDLATMPHLLIAGSTGAGKSVSVNAMVSSILFRCTPDDVRFIMIDPKRLELGMYEEIPHLLTPVVVDPKKAANALRWAVREMEERYKKMSKIGVRNIDGFNERDISDKPRFLRRRAHPLTRRDVRQISRDARARRAALRFQQPALPFARGRSKSP